MNRVTYKDKHHSYIRLVATMPGEIQILKDLIASKAHWAEVNIRNIHNEGDAQSYIDLIDESK